MVELDVADVVGRLNDLRFYSPILARRLEHEDELPDDAATFLIEQIETAYRRAETATVLSKADAYQELGEWLTRSYRYYVARLALADNPWQFRFPRASSYTSH